MRALRSQRRGRLVTCETSRFCANFRRSVNFAGCAIMPVDCAAMVRNRMRIAEYDYFFV